MLGYHIIQTDEVKEKKRQRMLGDRNPNFGKPPSEETRKRLRDSRAKRVYTEEMMLAMRKPKSTTVNMKKPKTKEHNEKNRQAHIGQVNCLNTNTNKVTYVSREEFWAHKEMYIHTNDKRFKEWQKQNAK